MLLRIQGKKRKNGEEYQEVAQVVYIIKGRSTSYLTDGI